MANRIQRVYRKWKSGVLKRKEAARNRAAVRAEAKQDVSSSFSIFTVCSRFGTDYVFVSLHQLD